MKWPVVLLACAACGDNTAAPQVRDGFLRDADGRALILRGVNLSGSQKVSPYIDDKTQADYTRVRADWGFNAIRFVMTWSAVEPTQGQYDDAYLAQVKTRMQWAAAANLAVVIDMHEDIYGEGFGFDGAPKWTCDPSHYDAFVPRDQWFLNAADPNVQACTDALYSDNAAAFTAAWVHVAQALAGEPAIVGFDVLNEPNWGTYSIYQFERDRLEPFYEQVVPAVRAVAPRWVAFLEPGASRNLGFATSLQPFPFGDVMYAAHNYDITAEQGGGSGFDDANRAGVIANVASLQLEATTLGAGLWIGEYGGDGSSPTIGDYMTADYDAAGAVAAGTMLWAYDKSDGYGLLDPEGNEKPALVGAVVRPYPEAVAGQPLSYAFDATTSTFTLTYVPEDLGVPTVISVPARVYPSGFTVECGCTVTEQPGEVLLSGASAFGKPATVTIHP
ncbi:MAG TPA: cellulase family glycosylhydrolase [Kofleriaceae bacterium]|jgi:endoglycosylceramidase